MLRWVDLSLVAFDVALPLCPVFEFPVVPNDGIIRV